jgi:hypothetical protein
MSRPCFGHLLEHVRRILLFSIACLFLITNEQSSAADDALESDGAVVTKEVRNRLLAERFSARARDKHHSQDGKHGSQDKWSSSPLLTPADFPILEVNVEPNEPKDFVVVINRTRYQAGAQLFRVLVGTVTIFVARRGKPLCQHTIEVTESGPNIVACKL